VRAFLPGKEGDSKPHCARDACGSRKRCRRRACRGRGEEAKRHGISDATIYAWRKCYGQLESTDVRRLRQLKQENAKLKKRVAQRDLEIEAMKEISRKKW
jgi:putative transposase